MVDAEVDSAPEKHCSHVPAAVPQTWQLSTDEHLHCLDVRQKGERALTGS